jgi:hypothetical protein
MVSWSDEKDMYKSPMPIIQSKFPQKYLPMKCKNKFSQTAIKLSDPTKFCVTLKQHKTWKLLLISILITWNKSQKQIV